MKSKVIKYLLSIPRGFYVISAVYLLTILLMMPFRELGFQDDFAYYQSVRHFLNTGILKVSDWAAPTLIFQILWGSIFSYFLGLSYKVLHFSNVVIFYFGIISFYFLLKELKLGEKKSVIATLFFLFFPYVLRLVFSFMTDVAYFSLMLISLYLSVVAIKKNNWKPILLASLFGGLAYLTRQIGIVIPTSLFSALVIRSIREKKVNFVNYVACITPFLLIYISYNYWLRLGENLSLAQFIFVDRYLIYLKMYLWPISLYRLRPTSEIYVDLVEKTCFYLQYLLGLSAPLLLIIKFPKDKKAFIVGLIFMVSIYLGTAFRVSLGKDFSFSLSPPPSILFALNSEFKNLWQNLWTSMLIVSFPFWTFLTGSLIMKLYRIFFVVRNKLVRKKIFKVLLLFVFLVLTVSGYYYHIGVSKYGTEFISGSFFIAFLSIVSILLVMLVYTSKLKILEDHKGNKNNLYLTVFLVLCGFGHFALSVLAFFSWWEQYLIPLVPFSLIAIFVLIKKNNVNLSRSIILILVMAFISISISKLNYDKSGVTWEAGHNYVEQNGYDPREVSIEDWAWIPYHFFESSLNKKIEEMGGNKYDVGQVHTWWDDEYKFHDLKITFQAEPCLNSLDEKWEIAERIEAKSVFGSYKYCVLEKNEQ